MSYPAQRGVQTRRRNDGQALIPLRFAAISLHGQVKRLQQFRQPAADGAEAVGLYASHRNEIAVVITDMAMPVMDGPAAIAALKGINPDVKIIGSSGFDTGNKAGAAIPHFIAKPYTTEAVLKMRA